MVILETLTRVSNIRMFQISAINIFLKNNQKHWSINRCYMFEYLITSELEFKSFNESLILNHLNCMFSSSRDLSLLSLFSLSSSAKIAFYQLKHFNVYELKIIIIINIYPCILMILFHSKDWHVHFPNLF